MEAKALLKMAILKCLISVTKFKLSSNTFILHRQQFKKYKMTQKYMYELLI